MSTVFTPTRARLTVAQFQKMGDAGIMPPETRVELVDGELIEMAPIGPRHMQAVNRLTRALVAAVGEAAIVSVQNPVALGEHSETQPDLALLGPQSDSETRLPTPDDVLLLIEVADATLQYDRTTKLALYARFGVREVWICERSELYFLALGADGRYAASATSKCLPFLTSAELTPWAYRQDLRDESEVRFLFRAWVNETLAPRHRKIGGD